MEDGGWREAEGGGQRRPSRVRWMDNRKEATDAADVGVAQQRQMHDQRRLHPRCRRILAHTHTCTLTRARVSMHAHTHPRLIEAGGSAPREAQGEVTVTLFLPTSISPLPYNTPTHTHNNTCARMHGHI